MKDKIINLLGKDKNVKELIKEFKKDFKKIYCNLEDEQKQDILDYRDGMFRMWLYSPILEQTYVTPYFLINQIAQQNIKGEYSVIPHIKIKVDNNDKLDFEVKWIYYSIDDIPVADDLEKLLAHMNPVITVEDDNKYVLNNGLELMEKLNFRSGYYMVYLIELALKLGLIKEIRAIGCKKYQQSNECAEYVNLKNREKIELIISKSIEIAYDKFNESSRVAEIFERENFVLNSLNNGINEKIYDVYIKELESLFENMVNYIKDSCDVNDMIEDLLDTTDLLGQNLVLELVRQELGLVVDMFSTSVFGYYLGIIMPVYRSMFNMDFMLHIFGYSDDIQDRLKHVFKLDAAHDLTELGEVVIKKYHKIKEKTFKQLNLEIVDDIIKDYKAQKKEISKNLSRINSNEDAIAALMSDIEKMGKEDDVDDEVYSHVEQFYEYLRDERGLKESTCQKSEGNINFFVISGLGITEEQQIKEINQYSVDKYLKWFIDRIATSKNNINEQISAIGQYVKFLEYKSYIDKETSKAIKMTIKNKEKYHDIFDNDNDDDWIF